jgi:hypothetical protein
MSKWYGAIQGNKRTVTRLGTEKSGFNAHIRGWQLGVKVGCGTDGDGEDFVEVSLTGGSNNPSTIKCLGRYYVKYKENYETER